MLYSLVKDAGCRVEYLGISGDSEKQLTQALWRGFEKDVFLISGGVSMGDYDLIPDILQKEGGRVLFHRVRVKPGKPLLFARKDGCRIFGIPGNPVSNLTTFFIFIKPALLKMMGRQDYQHAFLDARITADFSYQSGRIYVVPARCRVQDGDLTVTPFTLNGSADITGCAGMSCLMILPEGEKTIKEKETVKVLPINR
jgi:molybdopterin molybdotransferase